MKQENKQKGKRERTKEKIFTTAIELFLKKGYENTTVQEITEKADVAKGTFFSHFPTKDAILAYIGEQRIENIKGDLEKELLSIQSAKEQIYRIFEYFAKVNEDDKQTTKLISYEIMKNFYSAELKHEAKNQQELKIIIEQILTYGQQRREFKKNFSPSQVADILISIYFFILLKWLSEDMHYSLAKEYKDRIVIVMGGLIVENKEEN